MARPLSLVALLVLAVGLLAGCGGPTADVSTPPPPVVAGVEATAVRIPALAVDAPDLMDLGLDADGYVEVPPVEHPEQVGWYKPGVVPGDVGPAVLLAHVNGEGRPGAFARLVDLRAGDRVEVDRSDGRTVTFAVTRVQVIAKAAFPTADVYGDTPGPELRLITCGGDYDQDARSYKDQVIAYAQEVR